MESLLRSIMFVLLFNAGLLVIIAEKMPNKGHYDIGGLMIAGAGAIGFLGNGIISRRNKNN